MTESSHREAGSANVHPRIAVTLALILAVSGIICAGVAIAAADDGDASALFSTMAIAGWASGTLAYRRRRPGPFQGWLGYVPILLMLLGAAGGSYAYGRGMASTWVVVSLLLPVALGYALEARMDGKREPLVEGRRKRSSDAVGARR
ncbi:hypothetical protein NYO98_11010 [Nocardioides sp. STR2]|uniref:Integral membrane protein n=1 Tax=Nocardioides pini TaxID=2975053 RepID=A0ABT4CEK7_9ACTN|nr:hypothetical protein [Nocardioides pini]MCY4726806.1 hypothetical protein [Nocardioides pini]